MDNNNDYENTESRNSNNTEYVPTKCRITKPPPPKPATNPMQFVKVAPCPLFQKAHEQIKKVEEIKKERKEVREEPEDWQQNLDNWKSCRRKRQEHIIERVVEVKKLEQEEQERHRRKNKTFNEMIENRIRGGRHKFNIPVYDDDSNDLSDYGIGSSSSKTNSIKDVDTDDSNSILDEKDNLNASNQSQSEDESNINKSNYSSENINTSTSLYTSTKPNEKDSKPPSTNKPEPTEQYTYEGAIQDYRSRIRSKIHVDESVFTKHENVTKSKDYSDAQNAIPKGEIFKRKELFEGEKIEISNYESPTSRRLSEDFVNSQSIKQRLKSLEKCTEQSLTRNEKSDSCKLSKSPTEDLRNNNSNNKPPPAKISSYLIGKSESCSNLVESKNNTENFDWKKKQVSERSSSPETELYMDNLKTFSRDLDNLFGKSDTNSEYSVNPNYPPSVSSTELMGTSSDREDSGIHTADVSCSVSQADEPVEDPTELAATTIPSCIEKLSIQEQRFDEIRENNSPTFISEIEIQPKIEEEPVVSIISSKAAVLLQPLDTTESITTPIISETEYPSSNELKGNYNNVYNSPTKPLEFLSNNDPIIVDGGFPLTPLTMIEPPKVKPPPPPPIDDDNDDLPEAEIRRINSTKRIKREIHIKRSSFLGLDEPTESQIYPEINVDKPSFLQKEIKADRSAYKKFQEDNRLGVLSKVESHDSGLDIDRGRLSSDTWCSSSIGESITPSPERQDSEQTNSITSEEDEIIKKEREIIEMVEKEEKSRDIVECVAPLENNQVILRNTQNIIHNTQTDPYLGSENFNKPYFPNVDLDNASYDGQDSEVLKVEHDLRQLEQEELKRKRANLLFEESRAKARLQNNRSLENIFDDDEDDAIDRRQLYRHEGVNYRKSMPDLQHATNEYRPAVDVSNNYNVYNNRPVPELDVRYRKSMPDIQHAYCKSTPEYHKTVPENAMKYPLDHGKSLPDIPSVNSFNKSSPPIKRQPIMPGKPIRPVTKEQKDRFLMTNPAASDALPHPVNKTRQQLSRHSLQQLSAVPKSRPLSHDNWIQPRPNDKPNFKQHWLIQEAELRRISEQNNLVANRNWQQQPRQEKHLPDSVIQTLTQRTQNRVEMNPPPPIRRPATGSPSKEGSIQYPKPYLGHNSQTMGHALPMPYTLPIEESQAQDRMLSVSGKKKCSNCNKELGRGAAMIIESLCLFYHMECFICCVCHVELGDGRMGTDVRVRNQKLHCHNCYSSDDGIKFSCV